MSCLDVQRILVRRTLKRMRGTSERVEAVCIDALGDEETVHSRSRRR
jgi:hypothetical protein